MATFTDGFNRADGNLGSDWTARNGSMDIISNQFCESSAVADSYSEVAVATANFADDHEAEVTAATLGNADFLGPAVRVSASGCYAIQCDGTNAVNRRIIRMDGTTKITIGTVNIVPVAGDTLKLRAVGSTITAYKNGALVDTITDSTYTTGQPGIFYNRGNINASRGDAFTAADIVSGLSITSVTPTDVYSQQVDVVVAGTKLSNTAVVTFAGAACTGLSASGSTSLKITMPDFYTNNIKVGTVKELKIIG